MTTKFSHARQIERNVTPDIEERRIKFTPLAKRKIQKINELFNQENTPPSNLRRA